MAKTTCPLLRREFLENASPLCVKVGDGDYVYANPKAYSTGSVGFCLTGKVAVPVGDKAVNCQCSVNLTAVGSKDLPPEDAATFKQWSTSMVQQNGMSTEVLDKATFKAHAKGLVLKFGTESVLAAPREFSSGSHGWGYTGKMTVDVNGVPVKLQCSVNIVAVGSKS